MMRTRANSFLSVLLVFGAFCSSTMATWTEPVPLVEVNTDYHDKAPFLSYDGLTMYFSRTGGPGWYYTRIYEAKRLEPFGPFTSVQEISTLNYPGMHVDYPWVSPDNLRMYYYMAGSIRQLMITKRTSTDDPWLPGVGVAELNALGGVANPSLTPDELTIFFTGTNVPGGQGGYDIWMATRLDKNSHFAYVTNLIEINSSALDAHPSISSDGLTLYFASDRNGNWQLFKTTRESLDVPFGTPEHLSFFDSSSSYVQYPFLSSDGTALYFVRWPANDMTDIYVSYISDIPEVKTYYVDVVNGNDLDNGLRPETAFASIQKGIDTAEHGDKVLICPGVYTEEVNFNGKAITVQSAADAAILEFPYGFAVSFFGDEGSGSVLRNLVIRNSFIGILIAGSSPTINNVTVVENTFGIAAYAGAQPYISNSIFWNNTYSDLTGCDVWYSCTKEQGVGESNIDADPLFVDPNNDDYHLFSKRGRYWLEHDVWVLDKVTSPCIDGGNPADDPSDEPMPNGGCINMGAYGGTRYASMSEMPWYDPDINGDGIVDISDIVDLIEKWLEAAGWSK